MKLNINKIHILSLSLFIIINTYPQTRKLIENKFDNGDLAEKYYVVNDSLIDGLYLKWDEDGNKLSGYYKLGVATGKWIQYFKNGTKRMEANFSDGKPDGIWYSYLPNGAKLSMTSLNKGLLDGKWAVWYMAYDAYDIRFYCQYFDGEGSGTGGEQFMLRDPVNTRISLVKAEGEFKDGIPVGRWIIYKARSKQEEIIYKKSKDENEYVFSSQWGPDDLKDFRQLDLRGFYCDQLPEYPSYIKIDYNEKGNIESKVEIKEGKIVNQRSRNEE
jgi:antitoxin component YwqK of YwqJK toxin-antitoxin module